MTLPLARHIRYTKATSILLAGFASGHATANDRPAPAYGPLLKPEVVLYAETSGINCSFCCYQQPHRRGHT